MVKKNTLKQFIDLSKEIHGDAYSYDNVIYINNRTKVIIHCNTCSCKFTTRPTDHTTKSYGCSNCSKSKSERICLDLIRTILGLDDDELRPALPSDVPWLKGLYLDGYSSKYKFAVEYQGRQHTEYPNFHHKTKADFDIQQINDQSKVRRCKRNKVDLLVVPCEYSSRNVKKMKKFLEENLKKFFSY
jgi:hypothetical protein